MRLRRFVAEAQRTIEKLFLSPYCSLLIAEVYRGVAGEGESSAPLAQGRLPARSFLDSRLFSNGKNRHLTRFTATGD